MITVVDYGVANLGSMLNMLKKIGAKARSVSTPQEIASAESIILPGVGAFDHGVNALKERGLDEAIKERVVEDEIPILGVCLGMQLLCKGSDEGDLAGLGLIDAHCRHFNLDDGSSLKIPHMGWNVLIRKKSSDILNNLDSNSRFYFVHSYHMVCKNEMDVVAKSDYGGEFTAIVQQKNIIGVQFHPEKSHRFGMQLLRNFVEI